MKEIYESPCCKATSTTMNRMDRGRRSNKRRCVRCQSLFFCQIYISEASYYDPEELEVIVTAGRMQAGMKWKATT